MSEAASAPGPFDADSHGDPWARPQNGPADPGQLPGPAGAALSDEELLALLDGLGVPGTHDPQEDQEAIAEAEWEARQARELGPSDGNDGEPVSPVLVAERLPAGPGLASVLAADPAALASDWDLPGLAAGYRRLAAWAQARELDAAAEIAVRRAAANPRIGTTEEGRPADLPPEAAAEVALELRMTQPGASAWTALGCRLRWDLPATGDALAAGTIDLLRARIIAEATTGLTAEHASQVEARVLPHAAGQTTGQLRAAARRAVLAVDPEGAEQRRRDTERSAKISLYPGEEGTATLTGSCLPGLQAAAAMARITAMARALKSSGAHGGLDLLRANIFLGLLLGTLPLIPPPADGPPDNPAPDGHDHPHGPPPEDSPGHDDPSGPPGHDGAASGAPDSGSPDIPPPGDTDAPPADGDPPDPVQALASEPDDADDDWPQLPPPAWPPLPAHLPAAPDTAPGPAPSPDGSAQPPADVLARTGLLDVLIPWTTLTGHSREPAILGRIGPVSSWQARQLLALATRNPATQWRVILTRDDGRALAVTRAHIPRHARPTRHHHHGPGTGPPGRGMTGTVGRITITIRASTLATPAATPGPDSPLTVQHIAAAILAAATRAAARVSQRAQSATSTRGCGHTMASKSYRPPPRLREHIAARDRTCRFGPCGQPAWRTDLDHTIPWHQGGPTCCCNLGGCCRTHHKIKQLPGWHLDQPQPGTFRWTTPTGRSYHVQPDPYPV